MAHTKMNNHTVRSYDDELQWLDGRIQRMGAIAVEQTRDVVALMLHLDPQAAGRILRREDEMNELEYAVNLHAVRLMALRQPMASDLRAVVTNLKIAGMLERVGDYTASAARRASSLLDVPPHLPVSIPISRIGKLVGTMLEDVLGAMRQRDETLMERVRDQDAEVDALYTDLSRTLLSAMVTDPKTIPACTSLMFVSKNLERIGDQATNIAEAAYYRITGRDLPLDRPKKDTTSSDMFDTWSPDPA